jgi:serine phosphatase RsbU (regulator of sigma subunit)
MSGETVSGDRALVERRHDEYLVAAIDGLGHGPDAAVAAETADRTIVENAAEPLDALMLLCHGALARTRGAALTLAHIDTEAQTLRWVGVGNVEAFLVRSSSGGTRAIDAPVLFGGIVGYQLPPVLVRSTSWQRGDLLVMATDGIDRRFAQNIRPSEDVRTLAAGILTSCNKGSDDALVLVGRLRGRPDV